VPVEPVSGFDQASGPVWSPARARRTASQSEGSTPSTTGPAEADAYFITRPRGSRIGAWASQQSRPLESRFALEKAVAATTARYGIGEIPRPAYWTGYRVVPSAIEFWHDRPFRLHDRVRFTRAADGNWTRQRLYP